MALIVPNPTVPTNGQALDATPLLANLQAIYQAIQNFDASQIAPGTLLAAAMNAAINPNTLLKETTSPFVSTGLLWSTVSGLSAGMTSGVMYYNGIRVSVNAIASNAFTASRDTYVDIDVNGNVTYQAVTNNSSSPSITANSIRVAIIVSGGASITAYNQGSPLAVLPSVSSVNLSVTDTIGNLIYPSDPNSKIIGYRQITTNFTNATTTPTQVTGLSANVNIPANRNVKITIFAPSVTLSTSPKQAQISIYDGAVGGTLLQFANEIVSTSNVGNTMQATVITKLSTSASKTYNFSLTSDGGPTTATLLAAATSPAFILVELE